MSDAGRARPRARWTFRGFLVATIGVGLAVLAILLHTPIPLFLGLPLLLVPISSGMLLPELQPIARLEWAEVGEGSGIKVRGKLRVEPPLPASQLHVEFPPAAPLRELSEPHLVPQGAEVAFDRVLEAPHPCLTELLPPRLLWRDPLGLLELAIPVEGISLPIQRYPPELRRITRYSLPRTTSLPGEVPSPAIGGEGEFHSVRVALRADPSRAINWRATARAGHPMANERLWERTGDIVLLLDARPTVSGRSLDGELLSIARAAAYGIAESFLDGKNRVGVGAFGEFLEAVRLGTGRQHRHRIETFLRSMRLDTIAGPAERLAASMRQYFPPGVLTILLTPLAEDSQLLLVPYLRRRGYPTLVLSPSPVPLLVPSGSAEREDRLALRLLKLDRRNRISAAWREAPTVDWGEYGNLSGLVSLLRRPRRREGGW